MGFNYSDSGINTISAAKKLIIRQNIFSVFNMIATLFSYVMILDTYSIHNTIMHYFRMYLGNCMGKIIYFFLVFKKCYKFETF